MADTSRDEDNRLVSIEKQEGDEIRGPLGIWPFPILNLIMDRVRERRRKRVVITELHRDDEGRLTSMEEFEL